MCRVAAIVSTNIEDIKDRIILMTDAMKNGGPDDDGFYINETLGVALGHRRLSIIDVSENGHQPMSYLQERYWISFNGEIYNYLTLKEELLVLGYSFSTETDTEVLLAAYDAWGKDVLGKLQGMFAFVITDTKTGELFIARDAMGIKPLYMAKRGSEYFFSSEVKGFLAIDPFWERNKEWPIWFLTFGFLPHPITTLSNVWPLQKGNYIVFDLKTNTYQQYEWYGRVPKSDNKVSKEDAVKHIKELLTASVKQQLVSDVDTAVMLSGGIDSSILALLASDYGNKHIKTISVCFDDNAYSEEIHQNTIVSLIKSNHHSFKITKEDFMTSWDDIYLSLDQPTNDAINNYFISKYAKELGIKVLLSGLGADELFGGYPSFSQGSKFRMLQRLAFISKGFPNSYVAYPLKKIGFLKRKIQASEYLLYRGLFSPSDVATILHIPVEEVWKVISQFQLPENHKSIEGDQSQISALETDIYMSGQLLKDTDTQSMWHGVEIRVPFLDTSLVNYLHSLSDKILYPKKGHKELLIDAFKHELPSSIVNRKKQGFTMPFELWFRNMDFLNNKIYVPEQYHLDFINNKINYSRIWSIFLVHLKGNLHHFSTVKKIPKKTENLFLYLSAFDRIGGIENVNKIIMRCFNTTQIDTTTDVISLHDNYSDIRYIPRYYFLGFGSKKFNCFSHLILNSLKWKQILVGHLNLSPVVRLMKLFNPKLEIKIIVHGIEAWGIQSSSAKWLLNNASVIISVSEYTKNKLITVSGIDHKKIKVLPNCLDPFFIGQKPKNTDYLLRRYGIDSSKKILLTITRISSRDLYKGYDNVIIALSKMPEKNIVYILGGQCSESEKNRLEELIKTYQLQERVILAGFIAKDELQDHYQLADVFILPSKKEGFGLVLIEAAASSTAVIAGNCDGSVEALRNGELGQLVEPDDIDGINLALSRAFENTPESLELIKQKTISYYHPDTYKQLFLQLVDF